MEVPKTFLQLYQCWRDPESDIYVRITAEKDRMVKKVRYDIKRSFDAGPSAVLRIFSEYSDIVELETRPYGCFAEEDPFLFQACYEQESMEELKTIFDAMGEELRN